MDRKIFAENMASQEMGQTQ